jgi:hypothetical protein
MLTLMDEKNLFGVCKICGLSWECKSKVIIQMLMRESEGKLHYIVCSSHKKHTVESWAFLGTNKTQFFHWSRKILSLEFSTSSIRK